MENIDIWWLLIPVSLLPVFFALGWLAARVDIKILMKYAKNVPEHFYAGVNALVDKNTTAAAHHLAEAASMQGNVYELSLSLGKLYRQRGENDKAIAMHKALLDSPDTVGAKRERVLYELGLNYQNAGLVDRAEQILLGLQHSNMAQSANPKCARANMIAGDIAVKQGRFQDAVAAYSAIEQQNHAYLSMVGERLYDAYDALGNPQAGLDVLTGYAKTFPDVDLNQVIYDKSLLLHGEQTAAQTVLELIRAKPDLNGMYRLLGLHLPELNPQWKADADMMRNVIGRQLQKSFMYRCRSCHFKSLVHFWHCPACNKWETFTPNKIEI